MKEIIRHPDYKPLKSKLLARDNTPVNGETRFLYLNTKGEFFLYRTINSRPSISPITQEEASVFYDALELKLKPFPKSNPTDARGALWSYLDDLGATATESEVDEVIRLSLLAASEIDDEIAEKRK